MVGIGLRFQLCGTVSMCRIVKEVGRYSQQKRNLGRILTDMRNARALVGVSGLWASVGGGLMDLPWNEEEGGGDASSRWNIYSGQSR